MAHDTARFIKDMGVRIKPGEERVLRVILQTYQQKGSPVTFEEIRETMGDEQRRIPSKVWVYKILRSLKDSGFIVVEPLPPPSKYVASVDTIITAIEEIKNVRLEEFGETERQLIDDAALLSRMTSYNLAVYVLKILSGTLEPETSRIVQGVENVRQAILTEIIEPAKEGDIIRFTQNIDSVGSLVQMSGAVEEAIMKAVLRGIKLRAMVTGPTVKAEDMAPVTDYVANITDLVMDALRSGNVEIRIQTSKDPTYRMISLNNERVILFLTSLAHPGTAAVMNRQASASNIDDAIRTFDKLFSDGLDFSSIFKRFEERGT